MNVVTLGIAAGLGLALVAGVWQSGSALLDIRNALRELAGSTNAELRLLNVHARDLANSAASMAFNMAAEQDDCADEDDTEDADVRAHP